jgi:crotonobetainyl-CoA:carnitine CoA-transferase CaiB-like acyl-CoA transferase
LISIAVADTISQVVAPAFDGIPGIAVKMTETPGSIDRRTPKPGGHNEEVYGRLLGMAREGVV